MWPIESTHAILFLSGLLGGFGHCIGMCGPLVVSLSLGLRARGTTAHLLYSLGRLVTYGLLGGTVGAAGSLVGVAADMAGIQKAVAAFAGVLIVLMGLGLGGWLPGRRAVGAGTPAPARPAAFLRSLAGGGGTAGACFPLGMILGLLPCGLVYTALLTAAREGLADADAAGAFIRGAAVMAAFGAGTVPALLLVGRAAGLVGGRARAGLYRAAAALMVLLGIVQVVRSLGT